MGNFRRRRIIVPFLKRGHYGNSGINVVPLREPGDGKKMYMAVHKKPHAL
jgi:hypothetical protein